MYYKVLTEDMRSTNCPTKLKIKYNLDTWTYPQFGSLCCFDSLKHAKEFARNFFDVWECKIGKQYKYSYIVHSYDYIRNFRELDRLRKNRKKFSHLMFKNDCFPIGTVFTDKIKLLRKVS